MSVDLFSQFPVEEEQLRKIFKGFNRFMLMLWRLGLGSYGNGNRYAGWIMVIKHTGRKSGLTRYAPVNYTIVDDDVYCTAGFGTKADWYRNIMDIPKVELWLPDGRWAGMAEDATEDPNAAEILRQVIIASGFAGPLFGVNATKMTAADFEVLLGDYRLIRIRRTEAVTGPGGPGDLAWVWPLATIVLLMRCFRGKKK
jgi:deazaflavin-dependent oxidoreductase (nitroreductase family)